MGMISEIVKDLNPQEMIDNNQISQLAQIMGTDDKMAKYITTIMALKGNQDARIDKNKEREERSALHAMNMKLHGLNIEKGNIEIENLRKSQANPQQETLKMTPEYMKFYKDYADLTDSEKPNWLRRNWSLIQGLPNVEKRPFYEAAKYFKVFENT
jgi:hypothetical protein